MTIVAHFHGGPADGTEMLVPRPALLLRRLPMLAPVDGFEHDPRKPPTVSSALYERIGLPVPLMAAEHPHVRYEWVLG